MKTQILAMTAMISQVIQIEAASAVEFEPMNRALIALLGTPKVVKKTLSARTPASPGGVPTSATAYYSKDANGRPAKVAFVERGTYEPDCTHTWAIGIDPARGSVTQVRVIEMSCQHAFPTKAASFLDQFKGKGPADVATLSNHISTIAKATGSSKLATDAVKRAIIAFRDGKGQL